MSAPEVLVPLPATPGAAARPIDGPCWMRGARALETEMVDGRGVRWWVESVEAGGRILHWRGDGGRSGGARRRARAGAADPRAAEAGLTRGVPRKRTFRYDYDLDLTQFEDTKRRWQPGRLCNVPGCGRRHNAKGLCSSHGQRLWRQRNPEAARNASILRTRRRKGCLEPSNERRNGECSICHREGSLVFDHNHETGKFRGWLCGTCNTGIGMFHDNPELLRNAANYVETR
jgi:hypothetical protein